MQIVFVDGIGGKQYMRSGLIRYFTQLGYTVTCFDYSASTQSLLEIKGRLQRCLREVGTRGAYFAIGYSFGGVLIRQLLQDCNEGLRKPDKLVLLASPVRAVRLAQRTNKWRIFTWFARECGMLTSDSVAMQGIAIPPIPIACIYGVWPWLGPLGFFDGFKIQHDGMLSVEEVRLPNADLCVPIQASHAFIPNNREVLENIHRWFQSTSVN
ncbi:alpha/beta hydrolase [Undibacterium fentianense]|uniref:Alpha/beta hydrolase n=1 Tax=Undibacterium fentianense TaxID=2828728 RepID=A0A941E3S7_9BURK|nr:alpha/beta hydrolase [Undibacterium fentianense]MBR7800662.1 alpha/beta hydrolase [Undibacterium fentianense]